MPRNGSGQYTVPAGTLAVTDTDISSAAYNAFLADISDAITSSVNVQGTAPMLAAFNGGGFALQNIGAGVNPTDAAQLQQAQSAVPSGAVFWFAASTAPAGFLECNGASISTTSFAALFAAIGFTFGGSGAAFNIPDLRGKFIRGWDHSAGVDTPGGVAQIAGFIAGTALTVSGVFGGILAAGQAVSGATGAGVKVAAGTTIVSGSGASWVVNISQTVGAIGNLANMVMSVAPAPRVFGTFEPDLTGPHGHTVTDPTHFHAIADPSHNHGVNDPSHAHGVTDPGHAHTLTAAITDGVAQGGTPLGGAQNTSITTASSTTHIVINNAVTGISNSAAATGITVNAKVTGLTVNNINTPETIVKNVALLPCIKT